MIISCAKPGWLVVELNEIPTKPADGILLHARLDGQNNLGRL